MRKRRVTSNPTGATRPLRYTSKLFTNGRLIANPGSQAKMRHIGRYNSWSTTCQKRNTLYRKMIGVKP